MEAEINEHIALLYLRSDSTTGPLADAKLSGLDALKEGTQQLKPSFVVAEFHIMSSLFNKLKKTFLKKNLKRITLAAKFCGRERP